MAEITEDYTIMDMLKDINERIAVLQMTIGYIIHYTGLDKKSDEEITDEVGISE